MSHNPHILEAGQSGNLVAFHWEVIDKCQYKCTYCYATDFNKNESFDNGLYHNSYKLVLHRLQNFNFDFEVDLLGGEPTLHPDLIEIIRTLEATDHCKRINLYTNFTKGVEYYKQLDTEDSKLTICVSYHTEYHKRIINKLMTMHTNIQHASLFVEVNLYPKEEYFAQLRDVINTLKQNDVTFGVNTVRPNEFWDGIEDEGFIETFGEYMKDLQTNPLARPVIHITTTGPELLKESYIMRNNINYEGFKCEALMYSIKINGDIENMCSRKKIPITSTGEEFAGKVICPFDTTCPCPDMLYYKKVRNDG